MKPHRVDISVGSVILECQQIAVTSILYPNQVQTHYRMMLLIIMLVKKKIFWGLDLFSSLNFYIVNADSHVSDNSCGKEFYNQETQTPTPIVFDQETQTDRRQVVQSFTMNEIGNEVVSKKAHVKSTSVQHNPLRWALKDVACSPSWK